MSEAVALVRELVGDDYANAMAADNPRAVVEGKLIPARPAPVLPKKRKKWLFF
jgi:hypothetical protein